ncbi:caprin-2-like isoform X1 [Astyanax mexicanus]|uniref:Caprin-2-like isoform X1 n=1 Tax=Astyanax mexicanus TaxID=7994 RepID=A0A8T2MFG9_ASTMX|nr:caprin-2-like isoform X1 [Astyanax mexicanus]
MSDLQSPRPDTPPSPPEERARKSRTMVLLSPPQALDALAPSELIEEGDIELDGSPKSPQAFTALQLALNPSATVYHGYETYIEEGLICLKHKIRNIEKKKLKLEGYRLRLNNGETLNKDQLNAVEKYEEVVHNLIFARDLQKTFCDLTQDLLKAQKKAVRREQTLKASTEQRRLCIMLQVQYVLRSLQRDDIRKNFCNAREHAKFLSTQEVENLLDLASLLGCKRDERMSLEDQMEQASFVYLNLLDGKDKPVAGSTYKHFKEKLLRLVDCGFFDHLPPPQKCTSGVLDGLKPNASTPCSLPALVSLNSNEVPSRKFLNRRYSPEAVLTGNSRGEERDVTPPPNWRAEFLALKEQEPPDSWDMELSDAPRPSQTVLQKPWKGAAGFIPKTPVIMKNPAADSKQKRQRKTKGSQESKCDAEVEVFNSPSSLAKDPTLRRQQLDNLMDQITGSFSFIQDSLLDGEASPTNGRSMRLHLSPGSSPLAQREQKKPLADELTQNQHSTPLHARVVSGDGKIPLINGNQTLDSCGLELHTEDTPNAKQDEGFTSPPLYCRESCISLPLEDKNSKQTGKLCNGEMPTPVSAQSFTTPPSRRSLTMANASPFDSMHSVFSGEPPITVSSELKSESGFSGSVCLSYSTASSLSYTTASTQTPPEFSLPQDDLQMESAYLSESDLSGTSQVYSSPGPPSALQPQSSLSQPPYYPRNTLRGTARGSRGLPHSYRSPGSSRGDYEVLRVNMRAPGGGYIGQTHRDPGSLLYNSRENGYQLNHKRTGGPAAQRNSSAAGWSDSSQVSSPDRDCTYLLDSGHGDSLSISPLEVPVAGQGTHTLLPVHVYPVSQQLRVAFSAARTANFAPGTLDQPIAFDLLHSNLGDVFDASSGRFSCPAAGTYVFIFHILKLAVNVPLYINLMRNEEVMVSAYANDGAPDHETASNHAVIQLYHGDQVWLRLHRGAIYGSSWKYSTFSGFLLYQD